MREACADNFRAFYASLCAGLMPKKAAWNAFSMSTLPRCKFREGGDFTRKRDAAIDAK